LNVIGAGDVESVFIVERQLLIGDGSSAGEIAVRADEGEGFRPNTGSADWFQSVRESHCGAM
jgi:hypothetical protein